MSTVISLISLDLFGRQSSTTSWRPSCQAHIGPAPALPVVADTLVEALVHLLAESRPMIPLSTGNIIAIINIIVMIEITIDTMIVYFVIVHCTRLKNTPAVLFILRWSMIYKLYTNSEHKKNSRIDEIGACWDFQRSMLH